MKKLALPLILLAVMLSAPPLLAQTVRGSFVDPATGDPIPGARAVLRGADGREAAGAMTDAGGGFVLRAPASGTYTLRVERIGFAATETPPFSLSAGETVERRVPANSQRIMLAGIVAQSRSRCTPRPGSGAQTATVWAEARKVLGSARETGDSEGYRYTVRRHWRSLDRRGETIVQDTVLTGEVSTGTPFLAVPLDRLSRFGYVEQNVAGFVFHAPDARVLLSDEFQERHCFALVEGDSGLIGLSFEPLSNARPDVSGTLWLDRATAELRRMEYRYTQIPGLRGEGDAAGGRMEFARLPDGRWIVGRWTIRMPIVTATRVQGAMPFSDPGLRDQNSLSFRLAGIREEGGEVLAAAHAAGDAQLAVAASGTLEGTVFDSTTSRPLAGTTVSAAGHRAMTDSLGRFSISGLSAGEYQLTFSSTRLDSLRFTPAPVRAAVRAGATTQQALAIPPLAVVWAARCEAGPASTGALVGTVRGAAGEAAGGARVTVTWAGTQPGNATAVADAQGVYRVCGVPAGVPLTVRATTPEAAVTLSGILVAADRPRREDLALPAPRTAARLARTGTGTSVGVSGVLRDAAGRPVAGASVRVGTLAAVTTDAQGRFRIRGAAAGNHAVSVTHPSLGNRSVEVPLPADAAELELRAGGGTRLAASVQRVVQLAGIGATAQARNPALDLQGFYQRQRLGIGTFLTGERLDRGPGGKLSDVMRMVTGVRVMLLDETGKNMNPIFVAASTRGSVGIQRSGPCFMQLYVDGRRVGFPANLDEVNVADAEAVEVYRGAEIPAQYRNSDSACGVILVWTKR
ncbi:MAG TPA: carboxypeptidase regulatory-like domain-containing protein [Longimicrobium sp.]|nr:carboxypeptidase regulatory-like domain-containing protein [Longimicrobium sp.]